MAGYSQAPLAQKLGIRPGMSLIAINPPDDYDTLVGGLPSPIDLKTNLDGSIDFIHFFTKDYAELNAVFPEIKQALQPNGMLWISWPKRASKVITDLSDNSVREIGLNFGLVDVKVCAVDEIWSALKFVYRIKDRK
jgi:hypothetical protein